MSFDDFKEHYENSHVLLGERYFGHLFVSYRRNYIPSGMRFIDGSLGECAYDCLTELVFRDPDGYLELKRIAQTPKVRAILKADEEKFLDRIVSVNAVAESVESDGAPSAGLDR